MRTGKAYVTPEAGERLTRLHVETMVALQIVLATGQFVPGRYRRATTWVAASERVSS